jgi:DinB superfamily
MEVHLEDAMALLARTPAALSGLMNGIPQAWLPRIRIILEQGEARPFDPFDRVGFEDLIAGKSVEEILNTFATLRNQNLQELSALKLQPNMLARKGTHPALGQVTLGQLLATWVVHDLGHLAQIERVMARQYRDAVGPWREYLPILDVPRGVQ